MDDLKYLIQVLRQHPESRASVLRVLAKRAKDDLSDIPSFEKTPTWQSFVAFGNGSQSVGNPPGWKLDVGEGSDGVAGLEQFLKSYDHPCAGKWRAAAKRLRLCLLYSDDAENIGDSQVLNLVLALMEYDRQVGLGARAAQQARAQRDRTNADLESIIKRLASRRDEPAKELWRRFFGDLEEAGMEPVETSAGVTYMIHKRHSMAFRTFVNKISEARQEQ